MATALTGADSLKLSVSGAETRMLHAIGAIPGVRIAHAAARNGPGTGRLRSTGDGRSLSWMAPGSSAWGAAVPVGDGMAMLEDGEDRDKFVRVETYADYLVTAAPQETTVLLADVWNNDIGSDDLSAAEATAGDVETYTVTLTNQSGLAITRLKCWLDAATADLEISDDGAAWVAPTGEGSALALADLIPGATDTLHVRRTIGAASHSDPDILNLLHFSFEGL